MNVEEFEKRAETIVDDELNNIKTMLKKIPDPNAKDEADRLGLRTIDVDVKNNQLAYNVLRNFVANMILEQVSDKSKKINYEQITRSCQWWSNKDKNHVQGVSIILSTERIFVYASREGINRI